MLVVDDEPDIVELLEILLVGDQRCAGVTTAKDLDEAVVLVRECCPDSIVLDLLFGHRTCSAVLPKIRAACPEARIIVFTASERMARTERVLELGADSIRQKVSVSFDEVAEEALTA